MLNGTMINSGNIIIFDQKDKIISIRNGADTGDRIKWSDGDDKISVNFIKTNNDFFMLAMIIAETHGMKIAYSDRFEEYYGPAYCFYKYDKPKNLNKENNDNPEFKKWLDQMDDLNRKRGTIK